MMKSTGYVSLVILTLLSELPTSGMATRFLVHLPETTEFTVDKSEQIHVVRRLYPLPWLVVETANLDDTSISPPLELLRHKGQFYADVPGYFATNNENVTVPDDPRYSEQWHLTAINVLEMWQSNQGEGAIIALLDSGVDPNHPDLLGNILFDQGYDFGDQDTLAYDENGHGTAMAGLMVAKCYNQQGVCGVAPAAKIIPYKLNQKGSGRFFASDLAAAILAATESSATILSLSLVLDEASPVVQDALLYAKKQGKVVVAAVGNRGRQPVDYPANLPFVIGVGAVDQAGKRLPSSNYGDGLLISAPGKNLLSTLIGGGYADWFDGSSAATALVSGVLALIVAQQPTATAAEWIVTLLAASQDVDIPGFDSQYGFGLLKVPLRSVPLNQDQEPNLQFIPMAAGEVCHYGNQVTLNLSLNQVAGRKGDLYLRISLPSKVEKRYTSLFKVWNGDDNNVEPIPYNQMLSSPYGFESNLNLALYGTSTALLGTGLITDSLAEGAYELLAMLKMSDNSSMIPARKIIWITTP
jgi:hypothetical protein